MLQKLIPRLTEKTQKSIFAHMPMDTHFTILGNKWAMGFPPNYLKLFNRILSICYRNKWSQRNKNDEILDHVNSLLK